MIVVLGSSNTDLVIKCTHLPAKGESVMGDFFMAGGGKGANQAVAAARLGHEVHLLSSVGSDDFGKNALANLQKEGIQTDKVVVAEGFSSGIALILVDPNGDNVIAIAPGANSALKPEHVCASSDLIQKADVLLTEFAINMETIAEAIAIAHRGKTRVVVTPSPARRLDRSFLETIDIITPNETEAQILTGISVTNLSEAEKAARSLVEQGVKTAILTLGESGSLFCTGDEIYHAPASKVTAVDTTAAGDAFTGALAVALAGGQPLKEPLPFANLAGALAVTKTGAQPSLPYKQELEAFLQQSDLYEQSEIHHAQ